MSTRRDFKPNVILSDCSIPSPNIQLCQPDLALTPHDVKKLTERGIPVATQNIGQISDPDVSSDFLPLEHRRGVDINTAWEISQRAKHNLISSYKRSKTK